MRNDDLSQSGNHPTANDDYDVIPAGSGNSATGNTITGQGTISGAAGADQAVGAHVTSIVGAGGGDGASMEAAGRYGSIKIDAQGNYSYTRSKSSPDNVEDVFTYTLADKGGALDSARLIIRIEGKEDQAKIQDGAQRIVAGNEVITLPAGVELSDIHVVGRDLVIDLPDGTQMVIVDGAVFVPQLALGDVELPADTLAQLLIDSEPRPAAGPPQSSGGNFGEPVAPLDPGVPLGDLLPPTELDYTPPEFEETYIPQRPNEVDNPPIGAAPITLEVDDDALPTGTNSASNDEVNSGTLTFTAGSDALTGFAFSTDLSTLGGGLTWTRISDTVIEGRDGGVLIVTLELSAPASIPGGTSGGVTVTMTLAHNYDSHPGINADDLQSLGSIVVIASENDGSTATGTVNVGVSDDVPDASGASAASGIVIDETAAGTPAGFPIEMTSADPMITGTGVFGADGPAAVGSKVFTLSLSNGGDSMASGLMTAQGDQPITLNLSVDGKTITGTYGAGLTAFTLVMNDNGTVTYKQFVPMEHSDDGNTAIAYNDTNSPLTLGGLVNATVTLKDGDGDTSSKSVAIGDRIQIFDDGPDAQAAIRPQVGPAILDETRGEGTDTPDGTDPTGLASTTINLSQYFVGANFGADGAGPVNGGISYALVLSGTNVGSGLYALEAGDTTDTDSDGYGQGAEIVLNQSGNVITGSVGETVYFTITIDPNTGIATFTQMNPIWHDTPGDFDELAILTTANAGDLKVVQTVTDADGDFDTAEANLGQGVFGIQDDGPDPFDGCPDEVIAVNNVGSTFTGDLHLPSVGEDQPGVVTFSVGDGDPVLDTMGNPVSSNGMDLFYFLNAEGVLEARAGGEGGDVIFTLTLNGDGTFTFEQVGDITSQTELSITDLSSVGGGNVDAKAIDVEGSPFDLILSTKSGTTVNTNATEIGIGGGNSFESGEVLRVDLVQNAFVTGSGGGAVLNYGEYYSANSYKQDVSGLGGSQTASFTVKAIVVNEAPGSTASDPADGDDVFYGDTNDTFVTGTTLALYDDTGALVDPADYASLGITVTELADGWQIEGLPNDYDFQISSTTAFNAVQIEAIDGTDTFKLGFIDITSTVQTNVDLQVPIALTDADGDAVVCDIDIHLGPPANVPGVNATVNEAGLDVIGSDGASNSEIVSGELSAIVNGGVGPYHYAIVGSGDGTYGTLTINPDTGHFEYVLDTPYDTSPDANNGTNTETGKDVFTYSVTDANGVVTQAQITINIIDDVPTADFSINEGAALIIDETDNFPANGNETDGPGGDLGVATVSAAMLFTNASIFGADGENAVNGSVYSLALSSGAAAGSSLATTLITSAGDLPITLYVMGDGSVVGSTAASYGLVDGSNTVFSVAISADGQVTMTQFQAIEHDQFPNNYNEASTVGSIPADGLLVVLTVTDGDGDMDTDSADLGSIIQFLDDGPSISVVFDGLPQGDALAALALTTQDDGTEGVGQTQDSTSANFGGLFHLTKSGGSDGEASSSLTFTLVITGMSDGGPGVDSGLDSQGQPIYLYQIDSHTIVGSTSNIMPVGIDPSVVFTLSTTSGGVVTLTQYQQIDHPAAGDPDGTDAPFDDHIASLGSGLIKLVATGDITDNDGDKATDHYDLDLGGLVRFQDDGPAISASIKQGAALHIDESLPGTDGAGETDAVGLGQVTVAISNIVNITNTSVSADSPTTYSYALNVGPAGSNGLVDSGLFHSAPGDTDEPIYLFKVGGVVYGTTSTTAPVGVDANTVFTVAIVGGNVVMTQYLAIENPTAGGPGAAHDENSMPIANGALLLTVTATDFDGDTDTSDVNLGSIVSFGDDGPVASDRNAGDQAENGNVVINVTADIDGGSDGVDHVQYLSTTGTGTVDYDAGTQTFTYHPGTGESGAVTITYRVYDNDGDWDDATISFNIAADSKPTVTVQDLTVDEKGLPLGTGELADPAPNTDNSEIASGSMTIGTGSDTLSKVEVQDKDGNWVNVTGATVGTPVIVQGSHGTLSVTSDGAGHYSYTYTLTSPYTHPDHFPAGVDGDGIRGTDDPISGDNFAVRVTDNEGDVSPVTADTTINITVLDDAPVQTAAVINARVEEDELPNGITDGDAFNTVATGSLSSLIVVGADQPGTFSFDLTGVTLPAITSGGAAVTYGVSGSTLVAYTGGDINNVGNRVFTVELSGTNNTTYTVTLLKQIDHTGPNVSGTGDNQIMTLDLSGAIKVTDADLDEVRLDAGSFNVVIEDDIPGQTSVTINARVEEDELPNGITDGDAFNTVATGSLSGLVNVGADQPGTFSFDLSGVTLPAITSAGAAVTYGISGSTLVAYTGGDINNVGNRVFTVELSGTNNATYTVTLLKQIDHSGPNVSGTGDDQIMTLDLSGAIKVTDKDGDSASLDAGSFNVIIEDDIPGQTNAVINARVEEDELPNGITDGDAFNTVATGSLSGLINVGADQPGSFSFDLSGVTLPAITSAGAAVSYGLSGSTLVAYTGGDINNLANRVFTVELSGTNNATYTVTLLKQVDHVGGLPTGSGDDQIITLDLSAAVKVTDKDGDSAALDAGSFNVVIEDDIPTQASATVTGHVDEDELPGGITDGDAFNTVATGSLTGLANVGADQPGQYGIDLSGATMPSLTSGGLTVNYGVIGFTLIAYTGGDINDVSARVFTLQLSGTNQTTYTFTLMKPIDHVGPDVSGTGDNQILTLDLSSAVTITDRDGDTIHLDNGSFKIEIEDDIPTLGDVQDQQHSNDPAQADAVGTLHLKVGADGFGSALVNVTNLGDYTSGGKALVGSMSTAPGVPSTTVYTAYQDTDGSGTVTAGDLAVFTITIDPNAGTSGTYTFDLVRALDTTPVPFDVQNDGAFGAGPSLSIIVKDDKGTNTPADDTNVVFVTGWQPTGGFTQAELDAWKAGGQPDMTQIAGVNGSSAGWGINNNNFDAGEFLRFDFGVLNDYDGLGGYTPPAGEYAHITYANFTFFNMKEASDVIIFVAHYTDGSSSTVTLVGDKNNPPTSQYFAAPAGYEIAWVDVYQSSGDIKLNLGEIGIINQNIDETITANLTVYDKDGDATATDNFSIHIKDGLSPLAQAAPVVLDTNHDSVVSFLGIEAGVLYDMNGDGHLNATAWVAPGDSILFFDADGNGTVSGANEFVFGDGSMTDLEALHAMYGEQLDANDADFTMFGLWNDANSNGIVDDGEVMTLAEAGITSISLVSDGASSTAADGDVDVSGIGHFSSVNDNGEVTSGQLADAGFRYATLSTEDEQRLTANATNTSLLAVAAAAAGLAEQAAASGTGDSNDQPAAEPQVAATQTVAPIASNDDALEPQVSQLISMDDTDVAEVDTSAHHNAVVTEESNIAIDLPDGDDQAAQPMTLADDTPTPQVMPVADVAPLTVAGEAIAPEGAGDSARAVPHDLIEQPETAVDQLLAKLGVDDAIEALSQVHGGAKTVQGWDMADFGHLPAAAMEHIGVEASLLHPDAVQPVMHG